jgi:hypothetical protein
MGDDGRCSATNLNGRRCANPARSLLDPEHPARYARAAAAWGEDPLPLPDDVMAYCSLHGNELLRRIRGWARPSEARRPFGGRSA